MFILLHFLGRLSDLCRSLHQTAGKIVKTRNTSRLNERYMQSRWLENWCQVALKHVVLQKSTRIELSANCVIPPLMYSCLLVCTACNLDLPNVVGGLGILNQYLISLFHLCFCDNGFVQRGMGKKTNFFHLFRHIFPALWNQFVLLLVLHTLCSRVTQTDPWDCYRLYQKE